VFFRFANILNFVLRALLVPRPIGEFGADDVVGARSALSLRDGLRIALSLLRPFSLAFDPGFVCKLFLSGVEEIVEFWVPKLLLPTIPERKLEIMPGDFG
jgi:hypothetical protein